MPEMKFEEQADEFGRPPQQSAGADLTGKLVAWGLAANRQQAEYILLGVGVAALLLALYFLFSGGSDLPAKPIYDNVPSI